MSIVDPIPATRMGVGTSIKYNVLKAHFLKKTLNLKNEEL